MKLTNILSLIISCTFLFNLCQRKYSPYDFVNSTWKNPEGTEIVFYNESICYVKNMRWDVLEPEEDMNNDWSPNWRSKPSDFRAEWRLWRDEWGDTRIEFSFDHSVYNFDIDNINRISASIGDPDLCNNFEIFRTDSKPTEDYKKISIE